MFKSEHTLLNILDNIPDLVFYRNLDSIYQACNQSYAKFVGLDIDQIIGRTPMEIMDKAEARLYMDLDQEVITSGRAHNADRWLTFPDQKKKHYNIIRIPMRDQYGTINGVAGICRDITEKELLKTMAEAENEKYRAALEVNPDPIIVYDPNGEVEYVNPAFSDTFGWKPHECLGRRLHYVPKENLEESRKMRQQIKNGENFRNHLSRRRHKNGNLINVSISGSVFFDSYRRPRGSIITLRNLAEEQKMEEKLRQAQKMEAIGALAGGIAHDFNNLLTAIQGHVAIIRLKQDLDEMVEKKFSRIEQIIARGANLTKQLLGFARGGKYEIQILDLNQAIRDSLELFARTHKDLSITTELEAKPCRIEADHGQIDQVLLNLYVNAWQAMQDNHKKPHLKIKSENFRVDELHKYPEPAPGDYIKISVSDNGCGMDEVTRQRIFEPFFTTKRKGDGSGLGLSSVYGIIKNHGGAVTVYSEVGLGSTFNLLLPVAERQLNSLTPQNNQLVTGKARILLVDDEKIVREVNRDLLQELGYEVTTAASGQEALGYFAKQKFELVILDMILPEMSGAEIFTALRDLDPNVKVLLASGYSVEGQASEILAAGCRGFIQKPFSLDKLSRKVADILKQN